MCNLPQEAGFRAGKRYLIVLMTLYHLVVRVPFLFGYPLPDQLYHGCTSFDDPLPFSSTCPFLIWLPFTQSVLCISTAICMMP